MSKVNITVNGENIVADTALTLLDNILSNGMYLPHLCHNKELESYGGCGLCLVMVEGIKKPLRACSTTVFEGMSVTTSTPELEKSRKATLSLIMSDHTGDCKAPCFIACPTHQDVQGYVGLIANGRDREALELIKKDNPLPMSIGRVCPHPCEKNCRRAIVDEPVSICALKRFAADSNADFIPGCEEYNGKSVAVVGAGPAGLSCAYFLRIKGYKVTIFEAEKQGGGMLRYGIPAYRLPKDTLQKEIDNIEKMGVEIQYGKRLGTDFTVETLKSEYDAVFVAIGAWQSAKLGCSGDDAEGVYGGIDVLYRVANGEKINLGDNVLVVGGGNTAIDAVRTARRLGSKNVTLIYRRTEKEMPAEIEEIRDAKAEGVQFKFLCAPMEVVVKNGKAVGLKLQNMELGEPDASGRRSPVAIVGSMEILSCDCVISAIGQKVKSNDLQGLELTRKGTVSADEKTFATSMTGVFSAGDVINKGPDIAVRAIADGKYAARSIDCFLSGVEVPPELPEYSINNDFDSSVLDGTEKAQRCEQALTDTATRVEGFDEVAFGLSREEAMKEASRCLECGCNAVYTCELLPLARVYDAFSLGLKGEKRQYKKDKSHPFIVRDNNKCILCGQCVRACREISLTENLGLFGRGFGTLPETAFDLPLSESKCVSCGACVSVCPTGALTVKSPSVKNPPLAIYEEDYKCTLCDKNCGFTRRVANNRVVGLVPKSLKESCSLGVFLPVVKDSFTAFSNENEIKARLFGSIENYSGKLTEKDTLAHIIEAL